MGKLLGFFLVGFASLSAIDIPQDEDLKSFSLKKGIEVWTRDIAASSQVACRFVGEDPIHGKPHIIPHQCPAEEFAHDLPGFLDCCEEEIEEKGGSSIGLVVVGSVDREGLHHYLASRYKEDDNIKEFSDEIIQLIPNTTSKEVDIQLSYPTILAPVKTTADLKKLWTFYLIQSMAENRFKKAAIDVDGKWIPSDHAKCLLPSMTTVGHAVERFWSPADREGRLLKSFLTSMQVLKEHGFTESELADSKSQLIKHIYRFYEPNPDEVKLAEYYASHLSALIPCTSYESFMAHSFDLVHEIGMADIAEMLRVSFRDDTRRIVIHYPEGRELNAEQVKTTLGQFVSDSLEFKYNDPAKIALEDGKDPFAQLPITDDEQRMIRDIIHTVAESGYLTLWSQQTTLEEKRVQLSQIHPLRSIAAIITDPYTKKCLAEIMSDTLKRKSFMSDYVKRFNREVEHGNINQYMQGFCLAVKANADQVRIYTNKNEWEKLIRYLIKLNN